MIEVFLYRAAASSTFNSTSSNDACIDRLTNFLQNPQITVHDLNTNPYSTILGVPGEVFTNVVALSSLRRCMPLQPADQIRAVRIYSRLQAYLASPVQGFNGPSAPLQSALTGELYCLASLLFLEKILRPNLQPQHTKARAIIERALILWGKFAAANFKSPVMKWPLVILGCGAIGEAERSVFRRPFQILVSLGVGRAQSVLKLFDQAWGLSLSGRSNIESLGLDVLLRSDLLCPILV